MKKLAILVFGFFIVSQSFGQAQDAEGAQDSIPPELQRQAFIYRLATGYNDPSVARMALYNILSYDPSNTAILDTLALMYLDYNQMASAALIAQDVAAMDPADMLAVEIAAVSFENLGVMPKAIGFYETLYLNTQDIGTLYKLAFLQKNANRHDEALVSIDGVIENAQSAEIMMVFPKADKSNQEVSMKAAAYRLKGLIMEDKEDKAAAKENYELGLKVAPDFELLKTHISDLEK